MNILLLHNYYQQRGGEDAVFESEADLLRMHGHTVETLCFHNDGISGVLGTIKAGLLTPYNPLSARRLREAIQARRPDVLHVHNFFPVASPAVLLEARRAGIPVVMTLHNFRLICPNGLLFRNNRPCHDCVGQFLPFSSMAHGCYRNSKAQTTALSAMLGWHRLLGTWRQAVQCYITLNPFVREQMMHSSLGIPPEHIIVKPNFISSQPDNHTETEPCFAYIGRLSEEKGIQVLLDAFADSPHPVKILGDGPLRPLVEQTARQNNRIEYLGFQEKATIQAVLQRARALIVPSLWYENCPMTILEAFSFGTPVITANHGALPHLVQHEANGLLAAPGDVADLRRQIARMAGDPGYPTWRATALHSARTTYSAEKNYETLMSIYQKVSTIYDPAQFTA